MARGHVPILAAAGLVLAAPAVAQPLGSFRWQLQPYCNVITVTVTQVSGVYRLEGTDDQCGTSVSASVIGTAFLNPDGSIGVGFNVVSAPGGEPHPVSATLTLPSLNGTWRAEPAQTGDFVFTPGTPVAGYPRPLPVPVTIPPAIRLQVDGGLVASAEGDGPIPASGPGSRLMWYAARGALRAGTVAGGQWNDTNVGQDSVATGSSTMASGASSTAMGSLTSATAFASTAFGDRTLSSGRASTAAGAETRATADYSTAVGQFSQATGATSLAGGRASVAAGASSLAFGQSSQALGVASVAFGTNAIAQGSGSFVFTDVSPGPFFAGPNSFIVRASGGVGFYTNPLATQGVRLAAGSSQWLGVSDVGTKHLFRDLDGEDVLARLARMPVTEWSYKAQDDAIRHMGPTAQDFHAAFGLGEDPLRIGTMDADGVALAAVKALEARTRALADENAALRAALAEQRAQWRAAIDARCEALARR